MPALRYRDISTAAGGMLLGWLSAGVVATILWQGIMQTGLDRDGPVLGLGRPTILSEHVVTIVISPERPPTELPEQLSLVRSRT